MSGAEHEPTPTEELPLEITVPSRSRGEIRVSGCLLEPESARCLYVMAHGAGAGRSHPLMEQAARDLAEVGVATLRFDFPYMEAGTRRPDPPARLHRTVRSAVELAHTLRPQLPLFAGGRSMGGRMTSQAQAIEALPGVQGLIFLAFPLHPSRKPGIERAEHLEAVEIPMLFLSGTRDDLAELELLRGVCSRLGSLARLHVVDGADHAFKVLKRSGRDPDDVRKEIAVSVSGFVRDVVRRGA